MFIPLMEIRCPKCTGTQQLRIDERYRYPTFCCKCNSALVVDKTIQEKPNALKISLNVKAVA